MGDPSAMWIASMLLTLAARTDRRKKRLIASDDPGLQPTKLFLVGGSQAGGSVAPTHYHLAMRGSSHKNTEPSNLQTSGGRAVSPEGGLDDNDRALRRPLAPAGRSSEAASYHYGFLIRGECPRDNRPPVLMGVN